MKLFIIALCAMAAVEADVSHLLGHGYNYDKPSTTFELPQSVSVAQPQISTPSNEYLSPHSHFSAPEAAGPAQVQHAEHHQIPQGPSNEYLPSNTQYNAPPVHHQEISLSEYNSPAAAPVHHQEISQPQYNGPATAPVLQQQISQAIEGPSSEYLPPQTHHSTAAAQPPHYTAPVSSPFDHHEISQNFAVSQPQHSAPATQPQDTPTSEYLPPQAQYVAHVQTAVNHLESHPITSPVSEYLPPQQQYNVPAQVADHHSEIPQTVSQLEYSVPVQAPVHHSEIPQTVSQPHYSGPVTVHHQEISHNLQVSQPQYSAPALAPVHHQEISQTIPAVQPISTPTHEYLPPQQEYHAPAQLTAEGPAAPQYQEHSQQFVSSSGEYLPPTEHHHHHHLEHHQGHDHESQITTPADGYHYDVPVKRFRF